MLKRTMVKMLALFAQITVTAFLTVTIVHLTANAKGPTPCEVDPTLYSIDANGNGAFNPLADALYILNFGFLSGPPPQVCLADSGGDNTLDDAYDQNGAGAGRIITADAGSVSIEGTDGLVIAGRVGIGGTEAPQAALHVRGTSGLDGVMFPDGTLQTTAATGGAGGLTSEQVGRLQELLDHISIEQLTNGNESETAKTIRFSGVNVQVVNGTGNTLGANSLGNLIVGYNELGNPNGDTRRGSHNIVGGTESSYSGSGGLVVGRGNSIGGDYSSVSGGRHNIASGDFASVGGGFAGTASGESSSVSAGELNTASGQHASVSGGAKNIANNLRSSVSGGLGNTASGEGSSVSAGDGNTASGLRSSVTGGTLNMAMGDHSSVSGGDQNVASGMVSSVLGGFVNTASGFLSAVSGGESNTAGGLRSVVSGGFNRSVAGKNDWRAGSLFEEN